MASKPSIRKFVRRDSAEIEKTVKRVFDFVKEHPGLTSEGIQKTLGGDKAAISDALARLRGAKRVKTKGEKRATTYSA